MTTIKPTPVVPHPGAARARPKGSYFLSLFKTTDPKQIGIMYLTTSFAFFMIGGVMALLM
ncbi:MAG TPA: cytochrome ubiquinol oxidase subunit I, partial [Lentzea sp.]